MVEKSLIFCFWGVGGHTVCLRDFRVCFYRERYFCVVSITRAKAFLLLSLPSLLIVPLGLEESSHSTSELVVFFCRTFAFVLFLSDKCQVYNNISKTRCEPVGWPNCDHDQQCNGHVISNGIQPIHQGSVCRTTSLRLPLKAVPSQSNNCLLDSTSHCYLRSMLSTRVET